MRRREESIKTVGKVAVVKMERKKETLVGCVDLEEKDLWLEAEGQKVVQEDLRENHCLGLKLQETEMVGNEPQQTLT